MTKIEVAETTVAPTDTPQALALVDRLFDRWELGASDRRALLGVRQETGADPDRSLEIQELPASQDLRDRISSLLAVHALLRTHFPANRDLVYRWMRTSNKAFDSRTPVEVVKADGLAGLLYLRAYLSHAANR